MPRDRGNARRRLQKAALELFLEKGYEGTTAAEIAALAGVTERTFFRHFPDKREVLFDETGLHVKLAAAIAEAPPEMGPLGMVVWAYKSAAPLFEENLRFAGPSRTVIAQTPALQERQLAKAASIARTIADALRRRGMEPARAALAATTGMAVTGHGLDSWVQNPSTPLVEHLEQAFQALKELARPARQ